MLYDLDMSYDTFIYLFGCTGPQLQHVGALVVACRLLVAVCGIQFPDQGSNLGILHWEHRVLATRPPGKSLYDIIYVHWQKSVGPAVIFQSRFLVCFFLFWWKCAENVFIKPVKTTSQLICTHTITKPIMNNLLHSTVLSMQFSKVSSKM